jgi:hypothetical protein
MSTDIHKVTAIGPQERSGINVIRGISGVTIQRYARIYIKEGKLISQQVPCGSRAIDTNIAFDYCLAVAEYHDPGKSIAGVIYGKYFIEILRMAADIKACEQEEQEKYFFHVSLFFSCTNSMMEVVRFEISHQKNYKKQDC